LSALFEIVPNISEGRDAAVIAACADAAEKTGARVVHTTSDPAHHRSVITAIGTGPQVVDAALAIAAVAVERIDLRTHRGEHPRIGALDVLPFVPLGKSTLAEAVHLATTAAERLWTELHVPSYLYGAAARTSQRENLADVRRGEFEALATRMLDPLWEPDFGDHMHVEAGASAVGARAFLIAFNVELATSDLRVAAAIARLLRGRDGGLRTLKALAMRLDDERVQVSFNVTDIDALPLYRITELVRSLAAQHGVAVRRSELIGLAPRRAIERTARYYLGVDDEVDDRS